MLRASYIGMHATVMYRRSVFESVGGFDTSSKLAEDLDFYFRVARAFPVHCHGELVAENRWRDANTSRDPAMMPKATLAVLRSQREYVKKDKRYEEAYKAGAKSWRVCYSAPLAWEVVAHARKHEWKRAIRDVVVLRYHPGIFVRARRKLSLPGYLLRRLYERLRQRLPARLRRWLRALRRLGRRPPVGRVNLGSLRRVTPISREFGFDRGLPIDRYYIEGFIERQAEDIRGRVLEIGDDSYTRRYGGSRVEISDVLHVAEGNPRATIIADLTRADHVPSGAFDCVVFIQTLHLIYDVRSAIRTLHRVLKPGGVLLATFPGISQTEKGYRWGDWHWAFTTQSARRLFEEAFPAGNLRIEAHGNVLAAISFLHGLAVEDVRPEELDYRDPNYEVLITLRAVKTEATRR